MTKGSALGSSMRHRARSWRYTARRWVGSAPNGRVDQFTRRQVAGWVAASIDAEPIRVSVHINEVEVVAGWATSARAEPTRKGELRFFDLRIDGMWNFCHPNQRLTVRADGELLPITDHGMFLVPPKDGRRTLKQLRTKLAKGYVFGQTGKLQLSKQLDTPWQEAVLELYAGVRTILKETYGYDVFLTYGSLLGAIRAFPRNPRQSS